MRTDPIPERTPLQGVGQILYFNWPFYAGTLAAVSAGLAGLAFAPVPPSIRAAGFAGAGVALFWSASSLLASYWIYDASDLCAWRWIEAWFERPPRSWINVHAGLDESTPSLLRSFPSGCRGVYDLYDPSITPEGSIARARRRHPAEGAVPVDCRALPDASASLEAAFVIFAAHELREASVRDAFFAELRRVLVPGGKVLLVEHLRDGVNFLAFGPGAFHFLPRREWLRLAAGAGFTVAREEARTPFVRVLLLERSS